MKSEVREETGYLRLEFQREAGGINLGVISVEKALNHELGEMSKGVSVKSRDAI